MICTAWASLLPQKASVPFARFSLASSISRARFSLSLRISLQFPPWLPHSLSLCGVGKGVDLDKLTFLHKCDFTPHRPKIHSRTSNATFLRLPYSHSCTKATFSKSAKILAFCCLFVGLRSALCSGFALACFGQPVLSSIRVSAFLLFTCFFVR